MINVCTINAKKQKNGYKQRNYVYETCNPVYEINACGLFVWF